MLFSMSWIKNFWQNRKKSNWPDVIRLFMVIVWFLFVIHRVRNNKEKCWFQIILMLYKFYYIYYVWRHWQCDLIMTVWQAWKPSICANPQNTQQTKIRDSFANFVFIIFFVSIIFIILFSNIIQKNNIIPNTISYICKLRKILYYFYF